MRPTPSNPHTAAPVRNVQMHVTVQTEPDVEPPDDGRSNTDGTDDDGQTGRGALTGRTSRSTGEVGSLRSLCASEQVAIHFRLVRVVICHGACGGDVSRNGRFGRDGRGPGRDGPHSISRVVPVSGSSHGGHRLLLADDSRSGGRQWTTVGVGGGGSGGPGGPSTGGGGGRGDRGGERGCERCRGASGYTIIGWAGEGGSEVSTVRDRIVRSCRSSVAHRTPSLTSRARLSCADYIGLLLRARHRHDNMATHTPHSTPNALEQRAITPTLTK